MEIASARPTIIGRGQQLGLKSSGERECVILPYWTKEGD